MYSIISLKSQFKALQILHKTSVVTFSPLVNLAIEEELTPVSSINCFLFIPLSISSFHIKKSLDILYLDFNFFYHETGKFIFLFCMLLRASIIAQFSLALDFKYSIISS